MAARRARTTVSRSPPIPIRSLRSFRPHHRLPRHKANTFATLSVVFAFLFAPVGAVLGHLGLSQIRRTGQRGHDRALIGLTLSYAFILIAVVALVIWAVVRHEAGAVLDRRDAPSSCDEFGRPG